MVGLLNILVFVVCLAIIYAWRKTKKHWLILVMLGFLIVYNQFQPSYMPKGTVERTSVPSFDAPKGEIKDNNRKPVPSEERNAAQQQQYKDGLPWSSDSK